MTAAHLSKAEHRYMLAVNVAQHVRLCESATDGVIAHLHELNLNFMRRKMIQWSI